MIFLVALFALLLGAEPAHAGFLLIPILGAIGVTGAAASIIGSLLVGALSIGISLLLKPKRSSQGQQDAGVELTIRVDPLVPMSLIVGRAVVAGSREYIESYGTNNTDCIEIIALADHPVEGLVTAYVEAQAAALTDTATTRGYTVDGYDGNLALKFFDGSQVTADAYTVAALSAHAERPWSTAHIGRGRTYVRAHYIYNREKVPGPLNWKFVVDGIKLYNPAKDSSVGGSGSHRFDDLSTHEFTSNLAIICYNILRGIRVTDSTSALVHFYGIEGTPAANLPLDNWFAAIAEADVAISIAAGGTEPQFHGGLEIPVPMEPLQACKEILKATGGRLVEIGGIYKLYLGAPGLPIVAFDDGFIPANRSDLFNPITPLEAKVTYVEGSYVSPDDGWIEKAAPPRINADEETTIGRRVPAELKAPMVQSGPHMQRIMQQIINRALRERRHTLPLPHSMFGIEPGDVLEWDSTRNGYSNKLFEVVSAEIDVNLVTTVQLLEVDPDDYDWASGDEETEADGSLVTSRPAAKVIAGFAVAAFIHVGDGVGRQRPALRLTWADPQDDDLIRIVFDVRTAADITNVAHGDAGDPSAEAAIILAGLLGNTAYQVRARFESFNGYATEWSLWIDVTTPDIPDSISGVTAEIDALLDQLRSTTQAFLAGRLQELSDEIERLAQLNNGSYAIVEVMLNRVISTVGQRVGSSEASVTTLFEAQATQESAIATALQSLIAQTSAGLATGFIRFVASSSPAGVVASYAIEVRAEADGDFEFAGLYIDVGVVSLGGISRIRLETGQFSVMTPGGDLLFQDGVLSSPDGLLSIDLINGRIVVYEEA